MRRSTRRLTAASVLWATALCVAALAAAPLRVRATTPSPTPTFTPTPRIVEIAGRIFDASVGPNAGIAGANVEYAQQGVTASLVTDDQGEFSFLLTIPDSEDLIVRAAADGFIPELRSIRAGDLRRGGRVDIGLQPATMPLTTFIFGRVYDASMGTDAVLPHATIQFRQYGPSTPSPVFGAFSADDDGLYGFQLQLGAGDQVVFTIDSPGFATLETTISAFQLVAQERVNFGLAPVGGVLQIEPSTAQLNCTGDLDVKIGNVGAPGDTLVVLGVDLFHGYSQGDYGTGFSWDLSGITFPVLLQSGEHFTVPVSYAWYNQQFRSRLHLNVISGARDGNASAVYFGTMENCPSTPTPPATMTPSASPTPTATRSATPQQTGELGTKEVHGRIFDSASGPSTGIAGAVVDYDQFSRVGESSSGSVVTDVTGEFVFTLTLHDTDIITVTATAAGYHGREIELSGYELWSSARLDMGLEPQSGEGHRVWGPVARDPYCPAEAAVRVVLEASDGATRTVLLPPSNEFSFDGVANGDYTLRAESDCQLSFAPPQTVHVRGADVYAQVYFDAGCPPVIVIEPDHGPPGTIVTVTGRCYSIHSGGQAVFFVDGESVASEHAGTSGNYRADFHIPSTASAGWHTIEVRGNGGVLGSAGFWVDFDSAPLCTGDCNADGHVDVAELVNGVRLAFGIEGATCSTLAKDQYGLVPVAELVAAVNSALNGCPSGPASGDRPGE